MASSRDPEHPSAHGGVSRRGFITSVGTGAIGAVATASISGAETTRSGPDTVAADGTSTVTLRVNGITHRVAVEPRWSLLFVLRDRLGLTGTKVGCERGECGACTVLVNEETRYACMMLAVEADGHAITTIEGLMQGEELGPVQQAFVEHDGFQCGYCTSGQIISVEALLRKNPAPSFDEIRTGVSGNLCRCGAYTHIFEAAARAAVLRRG